MRADLREMRKQGLYPFIVGAVGEVGIALVTLLIVLALAAWLPA